LPLWALRGKKKEIGQEIKTLTKKGKIQKNILFSFWVNKMSRVRFFNKIM
jgi:hypothetical protein